MKKLSKKLACSVVALAAPVFIFNASTASADPMTAQDLATLKRVGAPAVSPDKKHIVYSVTETSSDSYDRTTGLFWIDTGAGAGKPAPIANLDDASEHSPSYASDGFLYFLSDKSGSEQLWRVKPGAGQTPKQVSDLTVDIAGYSVSPDGQKIAVWADMAKGRLPHIVKAEATQKGGTGRAYDQQFVRHWSNWEVPGEYSRIFVYNMGADGKIDTSSAKDILADLVGDAPTKPFGGGEEISWSSDSENIAFTMRKADANEPRSTNTDIFVASASGDGPVVNITADNLATDTMPVFSPDGSKIAYAAMKRPGYESDRLVLTILDIAAQKRIALTKDWDRSVGSIIWEEDGKGLLVTTSDVLDHPAYRIDAASGDFTRLTGAGNVGNITSLGRASYLYTRNDLNHPTDIYIQRGRAAPRNISNANAGELASIDAVATKRFSFAGADGDTVWGQIIKPEGAEGKLPLLFLVHGGPQGSFGDSWSTRWNPKVMASQGYAVVTVDFHGSAGYGQKFMDSINQDWGGKPLTDLKLGLAAAAREDTQIDTKNACALGASYGGYMMNWISGQWNDGFKCIINHAGLFDMRSFYYATEELWFPIWDFGGTYEEQTDLYEKWNPVNHIDNWQTPTLVIHGEKDFRVPYGQSLMAYTALQEKGIESRLLVFPDENHWILKGKNSVQWHDEVFAWADKWLKPEE